MASRTPHREFDDGLTAALRIGDPERYVVHAPDGTRLIARHWPKGEGPTIVLCDGLGCDGYIWPYFLRRFVGERPIFHLQWRGHGESDVPTDLESVRLKVIANDLSDALEQFHIEDVVLLGHSMGVPIALECWRAAIHGQFSSSVQGLGLLCGVYENPIRTWHGAFADHALRPFANVLMNTFFDRASLGVISRWGQLSSVWKKLVATNFAYASTVTGELNPAYVREEDFRPYMEHLGRMDMRVFFQLARDMRDHSAADVLSTIDVPTLVVGGARDKFAPPWIAEAMHDRIDGSELLMMVEGSHCAPIEQPRLIERALLKTFARIDAFRRGEQAA